LSQKHGTGIVKCIDILRLPDRLDGRPGFYRPAFPAKIADHCTRGTTPPGETWNLFLDQPRSLGYQSNLQSNVSDSDNVVQEKNENNHMS
jgi:hypothetical protein